MNLLWKRGGTKFIAPYWHSNRQRNTSSPSDSMELSTCGRNWNSQEQPSEQQRGAGRLPFPTHLCIMQSQHTEVGYMRICFSSPKQPLQLYLVELGWIEITLVYVQQCFEKVGKVMVIMNCLHQVFCFPTVSVYKKLWFPFKENKNEESVFA